MKNTKTAFNIAFFSCFAMPAFLLTIFSISVMTQIPFFVSFWTWIYDKGMIWLLVVIEVIIFLITVILWYTLRLKNIESITTEEVVKHRKNKEPKVIEKIVITTVNKKEKKKRKAIGEIERRVVSELEVVKRGVVAEEKPKQVKKNPDPTPPTPPVVRNKRGPGM